MAEATSSREARSGDFASHPLAQTCATAEGASEQCGLVTRAYAEHLAAHGHSSQIVTLVEIELGVEHEVNWFGGRYYDWSARQFDEDAGHPHVFADPREWGPHHFFEEIRRVDVFAAGYRV